MLSIANHGRQPRADAGFTLLEVLVTLAILGYAVVAFQTIVGSAFDRALVTKVNRQMRQLVAYQMGQITVGKIHPDEEDPFPDGQSGSFDDVGGYPEEYEAFSWQVQREEIPICGANEEDLDKAGFHKIPGAPGPPVRPQTDDILAGTDEDVEKPEGQFKSRVTLTVTWHGQTAEEDRAFTVVTYLPVNGEEDGGGGGPGSGGPALPGAPGGAGPVAPAGSSEADRSGSVKRGG